MLVHCSHKVGDALLLVVSVFKAEGEPRRSHRCLASQVDEVAASFEQFGVPFCRHWAVARDEHRVQRREDVVNVVARAFGVEERQLPLQVCKLIVRRVAAQLPKLLPTFLHRLNLVDEH